MIGAEPLATGHVALAAEIAATTGSLPAVATIEWCDHAAGILQRIRQGSIVLTALASVSSRGSINNIEAVGAVGADPQGRPIAGDALLPPHSATIEWWPERIEADRPLAMLLREVPMAQRQNDADAARRWARAGVTDILVGAYPLVSGTPDRSLIVQLGVGPGVKRLDANDAAVLAAVMPSLAHRALLAFGASPSLAANRLTQRECEVLEHLTIGKSVKEIAADLARSPHTVHDHVKSLHRKLHATSRGQLIARALGHLQMQADSPSHQPSIVTPVNGVTVAVNGAATGSPPTIGVRPTLLAS